MKKYLAFLLALIAVFSISTSALAFSWNPTSSTTCEDYTIHLDKYRRIGSDYGQAFSRDNTVTANINELVYWSLSVVDDEGNNTDDFEVKYQDLSYCGQIVEGIHYGRVTGVAPRVTVTKEEKTPTSNLFFNDKPVIIASDGNVTINGMRFIRSNTGVVTDVEFSGTTADLVLRLSQLGITLDDIANYKICMSDENLIKNFGVYCKTEKFVSWSKNPPTTIIPTYPEVKIPATGDESILGWAIALMVVPIIALVSVAIKRKFT